MQEVHGPRIAGVPLAPAPLRGEGRGTQPLPADPVAPGKFPGGRACVLLFLRSMQRELYFSTIDFLIKTIEAKDAEMEDADEDTDLHLLESEMTNLQRRLHVEFCYLSAFADGDGQAH
jgi:hypothetical protein